MALQKEETALYRACDAVSKLHPQRSRGGKDAHRRIITPRQQIHVPRSNNQYDQFYVTSASGQPLLRIVTLTLPDMGPVSAAAASAELIKDWHPAELFLVGICAAIPRDSQMKLGDIILADRIIDRDTGKYTAAGIKLSHPSLYCHPALRVRLRQFAERFSVDHLVRPLAEAQGDYRLLKTRLRARYPMEVVAPWLRDKASTQIQEIVSEINDRPEISPHDRVDVHVGTILSGSTVVKSVAYRNELLRSVPTAIGIEMEAAGLAAVVRSMSDRPRVAVVKGVCDFADEIKDDTWQDFAAATSATFVLDFLATRAIEDIHQIPHKRSASDVLRARVPWHYRREGGLSGWRYDLIKTLSASAADECDDVMDGDYNVDLSQSAQFVQRATTIFASDELRHPELYVTALDTISDFWFRNDAAKLSSFLRCQPLNTHRIFVISESLPSDRSVRQERRRAERQNKIATIQGMLDFHKQHYDGVYVTSYSQYKRLMREVFWDHVDERICSFDFSVKMEESKPKIVSWLTSSKLHVRSWHPRFEPHTLPINVLKFVSIMSDVRDGALSKSLHKWTGSASATDLGRLCKLLQVPLR